MSAAVGSPLAVYLELGRKRAFACTPAWPGWCRSGKGEEQALEALLACAGRYEAVASQAGLALPAVRREDLLVVERLPGNATTDFGAPDAVAAGDTRPLPGEEAGRLAALLEACWAAFDRAVAGAPAELRKGPRGGGRDRDQVVSHVLAAEAACARKLGLKHRQPAPHDAAAIAELRRAIATALRQAPPDGAPPVPRGWPPRYAARRMAWHVLDHAWEMEDRAAPAP